MRSIGSRFALGVPMAFALVLHRGATFSWQARRHTGPSVSHTLCNMAIGDSSSPYQGELRLLALHGSEGSGPDFAQRLAPLQDILRQQNVDLKIANITAPFSKGSGFAWWTMHPGERSFNAETYVGFETSSKMILEALQKVKPHVVLAHSQGAILMSALLGLNRISVHPSLGYILNGVAWPNPYSQQMQTLAIKDPPRVLFLMGQADRINPPSSAQKVKSSLEQAGFAVSTWKHPGGHSVPTESDEAMKALSQWIMKVPIVSS